MADTVFTDEIRTVVVYYDVTTKKIYDEKGTLFESNTLSAFFNSNFMLELHYVSKISENTLPENWEVWKGFSGKEIVSTLAYDDDFIHAYEGSVVNDVEQSSHTIVVNVSGINKDTLSPFGILIINPFGSEIQQEVVSYSSFTYISKDTYAFEIEDSFGVSSFISSNTPIRVSDPMFLFVDSSKVYEANIPDKYSDGIFKFPVCLLSRKLLKALDNTNIKGVSGKLEHKVYTKQSKLSGIEVSDELYTRDRKKDKVAVDLSDSKSYLFCCWSNEVASYWTKGNDVQNDSSLYVVENGNATLLEHTLTCSTEDTVIPFKTFQISFIVKNLVDYNVSLNVPLQTADWMKSYILNTVKANIDVVDGGISVDISDDEDEAPPT